MTDAGVRRRGRAGGRRPPGAAGARDARPAPRAGGSRGRLRLRSADPAPAAAQQARPVHPVRPRRRVRLGDDRRRASPPSSWTETADFCGRCHTMDPELKAYAHVGPPRGPLRRVPRRARRRRAGSRRRSTARGSSSRSSPARSRSRSRRPTTPTSRRPSDTCMRCHDVDDARRRRRPGEARPPRPLPQGRAEHAGHDRARPPPGRLRRNDATPAASTGTSTRDVEYTQPDPRAQKIDWVGDQADGRHVRAVHRRLGDRRSRSDVQPDIDRLQASPTIRRMDCIDCHNRAGHGIPTPTRRSTRRSPRGKIDPGSALHQARGESQRLSA